MSNCIFLFSICLITTIVGYTTWENVNNFLNGEFKKVSSEIKVFEQYYEYLAIFNKKYDKDEFLIRIEYFKKSLEEISRLNAIHPGNVYGLNKFSDMSQEVFGHKMLTPLVGKCKRLTRDSCPPPMDKRGRHHMRNSKKCRAYNKTDDIPLRVDWRERAVVTEVLNQKMCHACWAMSIVGTMETMAAIDSGKLHRLSTQELLDCSTYNNHCGRGDIREALNFLCIHDFPIVHEDNYPLMLVNQTCRIHPQNSLRGIRIKNFCNKCNMNEDEMLRVIANHGPVVVAVNARSWYYYTSGVIQQACANDWVYMNHVVQIVGYDLTAEPAYYIARNSWGEDFGEGGYLKLALYGNTCGLANNVAYFDVIYR